MKKLLLGLGLAAAVAFGACSIVAADTMTETASTDTTVASDFTYNILDDTSISITGYNGTDTELVIPSELDGYTVTAIGSAAFKSNTAITSVVIPEGVMSIGSDAFNGCTALAFAELPDGLLEIGQYAFNNCAFTELDIPDSVTSLAGSAIYNCDSLTTLGYPAGLVEVTGINSSPFKGCDALTEIVVDEGVTTIPKYAFHEQIYIEKVTLPSTITTIDSYAFYSCNKLSEINFPKGLTTIGNNAFSKCTALDGIELPETLTAVNNYAFQDCTSLTSVTIPESLTVLKTGVFSGCTALSSVTLPKTLTEIGQYAFSKCAFTEIDIPDGVTTIGSSAFGDCTALVKLGYPAGWTKVSSSTTSPFNGATSLTEIIIDEGVTVIPEGAFRNAASLSAVTFPSTLLTIEANAFRNCDGLTDVVLPEGMTTLLGYTFYDCDGLATVYAPKTITSFSNTSFDNCENVKIYCYSATEAHYACEEAGYNYVLLDDHTHEYTVTEITAVSCTNNGKREHFCSVCTFKYTEIVEALGHNYSDEWTVDREATCTQAGMRSRRCTRCDMPQEYDYIPITDHPFGDWIITREPTVNTEGEMVRICEGCRKKETSYIPKAEFDGTTHGIVYMTIVDAATLEPLSEATVLASTSEGDVYIEADEDGKLFAMLPIGKQTLSVMSEGCLTRNINITVTEGVQTLPNIGMSSKPLVSAELSHHEMTVDEMIEAGIDLSDDSNYHVYKYELKLEFTAELDLTSIVAYFDGFGNFLGASRSFDDGSGSSEESGGEGEVEVSTRYTLHYHVSGTNHNWCKLEEVEYGAHVPLSYYPNRGDDDYIFDGWYADPEHTERIYSVDIERTSTLVYGKWIYIGEGEEPTGERQDFIEIVLDDGSTASVYPVSERFFLIVYGNVRWLKEMYDVEMLVFNDSLTDTVENCVGTLILPDGLSLAASNEDADRQTAAQEIEYIEPGGMSALHWYVRGDKEGSYDLTATLDGVIMPFEEEFHYEYTTSSPLKVYAGSALHMDIYVPGAAYYGGDYTIELILTNVSNKPIYGLTHNISNVQQLKVTKYSDGTEEETIYGGGGGFTAFTPILYPGEKLGLELNVNIMFESEILERELKKICQVIDVFETFTEGYETFMAGYELIDTLSSFTSIAEGAIEDAINKSYFADDGKETLARRLSAALEELSAECASGDGRAVNIAERFNGSEYAELIQQICDDDTTLIDATADELSDCITFLEGLSDTEAESESFNAYDSIKQAIMSIPVRFVLKNVTMTTLDGSTTEIPYTIHQGSVTAASSFGVDNVGQYIYDIAITAFGEVDVPRWLKLFGVEDDPTGYRDAVKRIKATVGKTEGFAAKSATGKTSFRAWVVGSPAAYGADTLCADSTEAFTLKSTSADATLTDGVLSFTGGGFIDVTPNTGESGILYVEMTEDGVTQTVAYEINVVEEHECGGSEWAVALTATEARDGYKALHCDTCGELISVESYAFTPDETETPTALDGVVLTVSAPETDGKVTLMLENLSDTEYSDLCVITSAMESAEVSHLRGDTVVEQWQDPDSVPLAVFEPGDRLVIVTDDSVLCDSDEVIAILGAAAETTAGVEMLLAAYNANNTALGAISETETLFKGLADVVSAELEADTDSERIAALEALNEALANAASMMQNDDSVKVAVVNTLKNADLYDNLEKLALGTAEAELLTVTVAEELTAALTVIEPSTVYDAVRLAAETVPVSCLVPGTVKVLLSGTEYDIPCTYVGFDTEPRFVQTDENAKTVCEAVVGTAGVPVKSGDRAVFTDKAYFAAISSGEASFKVWTDSDLFELSCDNKSVVVTDGALSFTGGGYITVTALGEADGTLYAEITENDVTLTVEYTLDAIAAHGCAGVYADIIADDYVTVGQRAEVCEICGRLLTIEKYDPKRIGNANRDKAVNSIDLAYLQRYLADWDNYDDTTVDTEAIDLNLDGTLTTADAAILARHLAKWIGYETIPLN